MPTRQELSITPDLANWDKAIQIKKHLTTHGISVVAEKTIKYPKPVNSHLYLITAPQVPILTFRKEDVAGTALALNDLAESLFQETNLTPDIDPAKTFGNPEHPLFKSVTLEFVPSYYLHRRISIALFPNIRIARNHVPDLIRDNSFITSVYFSKIFDHPF